MQFRIEGINEATGQRQTVQIAADSGQEAVQLAGEMGLDVQHVQPAMIPPPPMVIAYADANVNSEMDRGSLDRELVRRLGRTIGISLICAGSLLGALMCAGMAYASSHASAGGLVLFGLFVLFLLPGILLTMASSAALRGGTGSIVFVIVSAIWSSIAAALVELFTLGEFVGNNFTSFTPPLVSALLTLLLLFGLAKLLYHAIRVLTVRGRTGERAADVVGVSEILAGPWVERHVLPLTFWVGAALLLVHLAATARGIWCVKLALTHPPLPALANPASLATTPYTGDLYDVMDGLPSADRKRLVAAGSQLPRPVPYNDAFDEALRQMGRRLIGGGNLPPSEAAMRAAVFVQPSGTWTGQFCMRGGNLWFQIDPWSNSNGGSVQVESPPASYPHDGSKTSRFATLVDQIAGSGMHPSMQRVESMLSPILAASGGRMTLEQARSVYRRIAMPSDRYGNLMTPTLGTWAWLDNGTLEISDSGPKRYIHRDGSTDAKSPTEIAADRETERQRLLADRMLHVSPAMVGVFVATAAAGVALAIVLMIASLRRPVRLAGLRRMAGLLMLQTVCFVVAAGWFVASLAQGEPWWREHIDDAATIALLILGLLVLAILGLWYPLIILRCRANAAAAELAAPLGSAGVSPAAPGR